jgi:hypothetical protein
MEDIMNCTNFDEEVLDLGVASIETKGPPGVDIDSQGGQNLTGGISND